MINLEKIVSVYNNSRFWVELKCFNLSHEIVTSRVDLIFQLHLAVLQIMPSFGYVIPWNIILSGDWLVFSIFSWCNLKMFPILHCCCSESWWWAFVLLQFIFHSPLILSGEIFCVSPLYPASVIFTSQQEKYLQCADRTP